MNGAHRRWMGHLILAAGVTVSACKGDAAPVADTQTQEAPSAFAPELDLNGPEGLKQKSDQAPAPTTTGVVGLGSIGELPRNGGSHRTSPPSVILPGDGQPGTMGRGAGTGAGLGGGGASVPRYGVRAGMGDSPARVNRPAPPASPPLAPAPLRETPIDPNGRFATTYRPGGGHLAAFESAVAQGVIPEADRELVSDIGARYWTPIDSPTTKALAVKTEFERSALQPGGGPIHMRVSLRSTDRKPAARPHLSVHLVLDVSGSMGGEPIRQAREAAHKLVEKLDPTDDFSLVTFSTDADVRVKDGPVGARRGMINQAIDDIHEGGGTNVGAGLDLAYTQAQTRSIPSDAVRVVLLLSDGQANSGVTDLSQLSYKALNAFQGGVQTSTFGLGVDYDGPLMSSIASDGAGGYYYLRYSDQIAPALETELDHRLDPVATAVEVRIRLKPDVTLLQAYGSHRLNSEEAARVRAIEVAADAHAEKNYGIKRDRQNDTEGGMRFLIPAFARDDTHAMLFKLNLPAGVDERQVATVEIKYKDRVTRRNVADEARVVLRYANSDAESASTVDPGVARTVQGFAAGNALMEAAQKISEGDKDQAIALLSEREQILRQAAETLQEPGFLRDAERLARMRYHAGSTGRVSEPLVLAMLLETAGRTHLH